MSVITVTGNLVADPELKFTPNGAAVAEFRLAENHRRKQGEQWVDDGTSFYRVTGWGKLAEAIAAELTKGQLVTVVGDLKVREYERTDGTKGTSVEIKTQRIGKTLTTQQQGTQSTAAAWNTPAPTQGGAAWSATEEAPF